jgi:hypothetical protein
MQPARAAPPPPQPTPAKISPEGFSGWLLAMAILQCLGLLKEAATLLTVGWGFVHGWPGSFVPLSEVRTAQAGVFILHAIYLAVAVIVTVLMFAKRAHFLKIFKLQLALFAFMPLAELAWAVVATRNLYLDGFVVTQGIRFFIYLLIVGALIHYTERSVRVRNTFVR